MSRTILVDDPVIIKLLPRVSRAAALRHSGRSFLEHLLCTWRILADWHMPLSVCRAGFLHSAYSTSFYSEALFRFDQRETVRRLIGREAEELVFRFCTMDRREYWDELARRRAVVSLTYRDRTRDGARVPIARARLAKLLVIESANIAEQSRAADGGPTVWMSRLFGWWTFLKADAIPLRVGVRPALSKQADERSIEAYQRAVTARSRRAASLLDEAIEQNPWAAEPRILRGYRARDTTRTDLAKAAHLLNAWGVAWGKRGSLKAGTAQCELNAQNTRRVSKNYYE
jgi:hypothetical protein